MNSPQDPSEEPRYWPTRPLSEDDDGVPPDSLLDQDPLERLVCECLGRFEAEGHQALEELCAEHPSFADALRLRIQALEELGLLTDDTTAEPEDMPESIGNFRLLQRIGAGGMGVVYEAEQEQPRRRVALKVIRGALVSPRALRRFTHESQLLAMLNHPGIARILEAGSAEVGGVQIPYFAMELIDGVALDVHATAHQLELRQRVELIVKVCDAIQAAHEKGVVHRDLKPGNILVERDGQPKILDFGLARITDTDLTLTSMDTRSGQVLGTLPYMSPEQAGGKAEEIDARSDVYSLGVVLYQILAHRMPLDLANLTTFEAIRVIRDEEPSRLGSWNRACRGDLETIVGAALEKEKTRRYASAAELAAELRRYLNHEPIQARPPSTGYQLQKFIRRHRGLSIGIAAAFVLLLTGTAVSTYLWREAEQARVSEQGQKVAALSEKNRAELALSRKAEINQILMNMISAADPWVDRGHVLARETRVVDVLDRVAGSLDSRDLDPEVEWEVRKTLGSTYLELELLIPAEQNLLRARELAEQVFGPDHDNFWQLQRPIAQLRAAQRELDQAEELYERYIDWRKRSELTVVRATNDLALVVQERKDWQRTEELLLSALEEDRAGEGSMVHVLLHNLGDLALLQNDYETAQRYLEQALDLRLEKFGEDHARTLTTLNSIGVVLTNTGRLQEGIEIQNRVVAGTERALGPLSRRALLSRQNLATLYTKSGNPVAAAAQYRAIIEAGSSDEEVVNQVQILARGSLAVLEASQGRARSSVDAALQAYEMAVRRFGEDHDVAHQAERHVGLTHTILEEWDRAIPYLLSALEGLQQTQGELSSDTQFCRYEAALMHQRLGRFEEACELWEECLEWMPQAIGPSHRYTLSSRRYLAEALFRMDELELAELEYLEAFDEHDEQVGLGNPLTTLVLRGLVDLYTAMDMQEEVTRYSELLHEASRR